MNAFRLIVSTSFLGFFLLIVVPIVVLFLNLRNVSIPPDAIIQPMVLSIATSTATTLIAIAIGIPLAYLLAFKSFPFKNLVDTLVELPLVLPPSVAGYLLLLAFGRHGLIGEFLSMFGISVMFTTFAIVLAQTFVSLPFMIRAVKTAMSEIEESIIDAAKTLGAGEMTIFRDIVLPLSKNGVVSGTILTFARAMGEFGATMMVCGLLQTMPVAIYSYAMAGYRDVANLLSAILLAFSFMIIFSVRRVVMR